jgi:hypothetical protein
VKAEQPGLLRAFRFLAVLAPWQAGCLGMCALPPIAVLTVALGLHDSGTTWQDLAASGWFLFALETGAPLILWLLFAAIKHRRSRARPVPAEKVDFNRPQ